MEYIGIIAALDEEIEAIKKTMKEVSIKEIYELQFIQGRINEKDVVLVRCGVGKVNAARTTQILLNNFNIEYVVNVGTAGSLNESIEIGDIVIAEKLVQHDFDITAFNHEKGYIPNIGGKFVESDSYLIKLAKEVGDESTHTGVIASGDIFCTEEAMSSKIATKFGALCVEMEGASIAQVCYLSHIPFLVIRSISDSPTGGDNTLTYEEFLKLSSYKVASYLKRMLDII